jgi:hypothetical protein
MTSRKFFFLHNPKAGGSSIRVLLHSLSKEGTIAPQFMNAPEDYRSSRTKMKSLRGYDFYFGHYGYEFYQVVDKGHALVTNFRDPVRRVYSLYRYWRHNVANCLLDNLHDKDAFVVKLAKEKSFSQFIRIKDDNLLCYISNFHFRQIHKTGWLLEPLSKSSKLTVCNRIKNMPWFFVSETPEASMSLFRLMFPEVADKDMPYVNVSLGDNKPIAQRDVDHLISLNRLDYAIHAYAIQIQSSRLTKLKPRI